MNLAFLYFMQVLNLALPIITIPYLTRTLGLEGFGIYTYSLTYAAVLIFFLDFGFLWSATKNIAAAHEDRERCCGFFSQYLSAQILVFGTISLGLLIFLFAFDISPANRQHLLWMFPSVVGSLLSLNWVFQGLQLFKEFFLFQAAGRIVILPLLFMFVNDAADVDRAILFTSLGGLFSGVMSMVWVIRRGIVVYHYPGIPAIYKTLKEGAMLFFSRSFIGSYTLMIPVLIDIFAGKEQLALFSIADKFRQAGMAILEPVTGAFFPRVAFLYATDHNRAKVLVNRLMFLIFGMGLLIFISFSLGARYGLDLLAGPQFLAAMDMLIIFSLFPLLVALSNLFGVQIMLSNGLNSLFFKLTFMASLVGFLIMVPAIKVNGALGGVQSWFVVEVVVTFAMALSLKRLGYLFGAR